MATRTVQCGICNEDLKEPKLLLCDNWFCLQCLESFCREKQPGDDVPHTVCRNEFQIPTNEVANLPLATCEACSTDQRSISATVYCEDCCQKLCGNCGIPHRKMRVPHDVIPLESATDELNRGRGCEKHKDEQIKMYCFDCNRNVCPMCCLEKHKTHKFERIEKVAEQFSKSIDDAVKQTTSRINSFRGAAAQFEAQNNKILGNIKAIELEVKKRCDRHKSNLLEELQSQKSAAEKEMKSRKETLQLALTELERCRTSSLELRTKGSPSDITQATRDVLHRAKKLLQTSVIPSEYHTPSYKFTAGNVNKLLSFRDDQNFIDHVIKLGYPGSTDEMFLAANDVCYSRLHQLFYVVFKYKLLVLCNSLIYLQQFNYMCLHIFPGNKKVRPGVSLRHGQKRQGIFLLQLQQNDTVSTSPKSTLTSGKFIIFILQSCFF